MSLDQLASVLHTRFNITPDFETYPGWGWRAPRKTSYKCEKCNESDQVWCLYADSGGIDYVDEYYHYCLNCGNAVHRTEQHIGPYHGIAADAKCPLCGLDWS